MDMHQEIKDTNGREPILAFDQFVQHEAHDQLPIELTTGMNLQDLNDDCLLEIFGIKSLSPMDLCSIAETCEHFKQLTQRVFPKKFQFRSKYMPSECDYWYILKSENYREEKHLREVERIFMNFGHRLSEIEIRLELLPDLLSLVAKHCAGTLRRLHFDMRFTEDLERTLPCFVALKPIFQGLMVLDLSEAPKLDGCENLFANCDSLTELIIGHRFNYNVQYILPHNFPKLRQFTLFHDEDDHGPAIPAEVIYEFLRRHIGLKTLVLFVKSYPGNVWCMQTIGSICQEVQELKIVSNAFENLDFSQFQSLKQLSLLDYSDNAATNIATLEAATSLEKLTLYVEHECGIEFWNRMFLLKNLRELIFVLRRYGPSNTDIVNLIRHLTHLKRLAVITHGFDFALSKNSVSEIVKIVRERPNKLMLSCRIQF